MRFLSNSAINRIYAHSVLQGLAENTGGIFIFVFLLKQGLAAHFVMLSMAAYVLVRFLLRQTLAPFVLLFGLRSGLVVGTVITAFAYLPLAFMDGIGPLLSLIHL